MKRKKIIITVCAVVVLAIAGVGTVMHVNATKSSEVESVALGATGKHCNGTVGCSCSGFSPKTSGKEWEKSYCKKCGHHKRNHH